MPRVSNTWVNAANMQRCLHVVSVDVVSIHIDVVSPNTHERMHDHRYNLNVIDFQLKSKMSFDNAW